jgi:metallopeptidase MepB
MTRCSLPPQPRPKLIATEDIVDVTRAHIQSLHIIRNEIVRGVKTEDATFENVVKPLANAQHAIESSSGMIAVLRYASPDASARKAAEEARNLWNKAFSEFSDRHDIYLLLQAVKNRNEALDAESTKYLDELLDDFVRCGHGSLTAEGVLEYVTRRNRIDKLRSEFTRNVRNASGGIWFSETELDGVLQQDLARFHAAGKARTDKPIDDTKAWFVSLSKHDVTTVLQYARNANVRQRVYLANHSKLAEKLPIFKEVISLRDANARQLGYKSHAVYRLEKRLAKTSKWVYKFMEELEQVLLPEAAKEVKKLLALGAGHTEKHECVDKGTKTILAWDYQYWKRLSLEDISIDQEKIAEYFPIKEVVPRMLDLMSDCLQIHFVKVSSPAVWDPKIEAWEVWDTRSGKEQQFIGYLYMDLEFRENKHRGCQNVNLQPVSKVQRNRAAPF